jgi:hypothetical protein
MESYAELEVIVQPFIVATRKSFALWLQCSEKCSSDRRLAGRGGSGSSLHKVVGEKMSEIDTQWFIL